MNRSMAPLASIVLTGAFILSTGCAALLPQGFQDRMIQRAGEQSVERLRTDLFEDGNLHVIALGTASPQPGTGRLPTSTAVIANDRFIVVDAGEGAGRQIADLGLPLHRVTDVLITHFHSDHIGGLGQLLNQSWNDGRTHPIRLWGPEGLDSIMKGYEEVYAADISYRTANVVEHNDPALALGEVNEFRLEENENAWVLEDNGELKVTAFRVDHGHVQPAVGYRLDFQGLSVVFSGDTRATPLMIDAARGADLLFHEAVNTAMVTQGALGMERAGRPVEADRARSIIGYHADTLEVAKIAEAAEVKHLVLHHVIPVPPNRIAESIFVEGMNDLYSGETTMARDGMEFTLKP